MATSALSPVSTLNENAIRRRHREAVEEMRRNGIEISPAWEVDDGTNLPSLNVADFGSSDFQSADDARDMSAADICNVMPIGDRRLREKLIAVGAMLHHEPCQLVCDSWISGSADWPDDDARWTLTPHQLRKLEEMPAISPAPRRRKSASK